MTRLATALAAILAAGCSAVTFQEDPVGAGEDEARGQIRIRAPRRGRADGQARGYVYLVVGPDRKPVASVDSRGGPWAFEELEPGRYGVQISGEAIRPLAFDVDIKAGFRTTLTFHSWRAKAAKIPEDLALVTGKTVLYVVMAVGYGIGWVFWEAVFGDDDDDDDDDVPAHASKSPPSKPKTESPRPRVRSLLKDP